MRLNLSWLNFYRQTKEDIKLWCYFVIFQQICRVYFVLSLSLYLDPDTKLTTILYALVYGVRFDSLWATVWVFVPLAFITLPNTFLVLSKNGIALQKFRQFWGGLFTVTTTLIYFASVQYFKEYKDIFNQFMFGWLYDDKLAILKTIYSQHHIILYAIILLAILFLYIKHVGHFIKIRRFADLGSPKKYPIIYKILTTFLIIIFYVIAYRGSIGSRPIQQKDAGVTMDPFLNKAIISPYSSFRYAIIDHNEIYRTFSGEKFGLSGPEVKKIAKKYFNTDKDHSSLTKYMEKRAKGNIIAKPKHIFMIVGESLDAWPLEDKYREFNLTPNLHKLIKKGIHFKYFLSSSCGTMPSLNTVITGIPDEGWYINYHKTSYTPYSTSTSIQFHKLGYKTQLFYGGYLSWQRLEDFAKLQGFDQVYGAAHINSWLRTNEWGVDDGELFDFIISKIKNENKPTFNIIMTTSNHPPFTIDLDQEGFDKDRVSALLAKYPPTDTNVKELGHIWYADKVIGKFIKEMSVVDGSSLFAITGDHFGRRHILSNPSFFEKTAVPFIIYAKNIKPIKNIYDKLKPVAGGHVDIGATLIELIAPKDFVYYSIGDNLLSKRKYNFGIGRTNIITPEFIAAVKGPDIEYLKKDNKILKVSDELLKILEGRFSEAMDIAEYIVKRGETLDETGNNAPSKTKRD